MQSDILNIRNGMTDAEELYEKAVALRREGRFGEAVNIFREAADAADRAIEAGTADEDVCRYVAAKSLASIDLINEIGSFVNKDLMNP